MAISQLNTIFAKHHRIIFGIFSVIIIIAFMDFLTPGTGFVDAFRNNGSRAAAGEIFGKTVSYNELSEQIRIDMLSAQVFMNMPINQSMREMLETQSFFNMASLRAAKDAGITVSDDEVGKFLRNFFRDDAGKFNAEVYRNFVDNYLAAEGFNEEDLNEAARQYLTLAKFQSAQAASVVVTPAELKTFYNMLNEQYEVLTGEFNIADFEKSVKVEDAALNEFFMANRGKYIIPAQVQAQVVEFTYDKYRNDAIKNVKEEQMKSFYEQNKHLFGEVKDGKFEVKEFDKVKDEVRSSAIAAMARDMALNAAQQFGVNAYEAVGNVPAEQRLATFRKILADNKLQAKATGKFQATDKVAGAIAEPALVNELASVFADVPISNAVPGEKAAFVGYVTELIPSREAELAEVKAQVTADFVRAEALKAARSRADEVVAKLNAIPAEQRIARVQAMTNPKFKAVKKFTIIEGSPELGFGAAAVADLQPGEIAPVMPTANGVQLLVLVKRTAPEKPYADDPQLASMFRSYKNSMLQMEFNAYLMSNCKQYAQSAEAEAVAE